MQNRLNKRLDEARNEGGFTLIELLIVIVILGILAAIVVFAVGATRGDAVAGACKTDVASIQLAADAGKTKSGKYPTATGTSGAIIESGGGLLKGTTGVITQSDYKLTYAQTGSGTGYTITAGDPSATVTKTIKGATPLTQDSTAADIATFCEKA